MNYPVIVDVTLRPGISDPEGATIERSLPILGFHGISQVRAGKMFQMTIEADSAELALETARSLAQRLLSNPVIEDAVARHAGA